jgi:hypothetical protein
MVEYHCGERALEIDFIEVAPAPVFAALGRLDDGMASLMKVGAGVAIL